MNSSRVDSLVHQAVGWRPPEPEVPHAADVPQNPDDRNSRLPPDWQILEGDDVKSIRGFGATPATRDWATQWLTDYNLRVALCNDNRRYRPVRRICEHLGFPEDS